MISSVEERLAIIETKLSERARVADDRFDRLEKKLEAMQAAIEAKVAACHNGSNGHRTNVKVAGGSAALGAAISTAVISIGKALGWF